MVTKTVETASYISALLKPFLLIRLVMGYSEERKHRDSHINNHIDSS
jgi:hypothetical protein